MLLLYALPLSIFPPSSHATDMADMAPRRNPFRNGKDQAIYNELSDNERDSSPSPRIYPPVNLATPNTPKTMRSRTASAVASQDFQRTPYNHDSERRDSGSSPALPPPSRSPIVPVFTTPARMKSTTASAVASQDFQRTPYNHGSGAMSRCEEDFAPKDAKHFRDNYKTYLKEDLATNRVLVDEDAFLEVVYNISRKERLGEAHIDLLNKISDDTTFKTAWNAYAACCERVGSGKRPEKKLYQPRVDVYNAALAVLDKLQPRKVGGKERIRFCVNDPARLKHGIYANGLSVDLGQVSECLFGTETPSLKEHPLGAAMLLGAEELKAKRGCLITGKELRYRAKNLKDGRAPEVNENPFISNSEGATQDGEDCCF
ncbi:hypothetical protein CPB85DRAFT_453963 [Mucidula mucida]|nr:hypothetical protein CPB85DRAFT_453963 [Mucidula mucida]